MLRSLNPVTKETAIAAPRLGRPSPDPGFGPPIELSGGHACRLLDLVGIGKALPGEGIAAEESPPAFLEIEPTGSSGDEDVLDAWMICQPSPGLQAVMAAEIVGDDEEIPGRIVRFDVGKQLDVIPGITRGSTPGQLLAISYP